MDMDRDLQVTASASCDGYRPLRRAPMAGRASIHLRTTLTGITYLVTVDLWDLDESVRHGLYDGHDIEIGGRRYTTHDRDPSPLPGPVRSAFHDAMIGVGAWMDSTSTTIDRVLTWGKIAGERAEREAKLPSRRGRYEDPASRAKPPRSSVTTDGTVTAST